jgi:class 3 adenylate cyclase
MGKNANKVYMLVTPLILAKMVFDEGTCDEIMHCVLSLLGWLLSYLDDPELGARLGKLGMSIATQHSLEGCLSYFFGYCQFICQDTPLQLLQKMKESEIISTSVNDTSYGTLTCTWVSIMNMLILGEPLVVLLDQMNKMKQGLNDEYQDHIRAMEELIRVLLGETNEFIPQYVIGESIEDLPYSRFITRFGKMLGYYFLGDYRNAYRTLKHATSLVEDVYGSPIFFLFRWYSTVVASTYYEHYDQIANQDTPSKKKQFSIMEHVLGKDARKPKTERERVLDEVSKHVTDCQDLYKRAPQFMSAAYELSQAELARVQGDSKCKQFYKNAEKLAHEQGLVFLRAVITSRMTSYEKDDQLIESAFHQWSEMGAKRICNMLQETYPQLTTDSVTSIAQEDRFTPNRKLLNHLGKSSTELRAGDAMSKRITVMSIDLLHFTIVDKSPVEIIFMLNAFVNTIIPIIEKHHGFVEKAITQDTIYAMFHNINDAMKTCIELKPMILEKIGIGICTGPSIIGVVEYSHRLETVVVSETIQTSRLLQRLGKQFEIGVLTTQQVWEQAHCPEISSRPVATVVIHDVEYELVEVCQNDNKIRTRLQNAVQEHFVTKQFEQFSKLCGELLQIEPNKLVEFYKKTSDMYIEVGFAPDAWHGEITIDTNGSLVPIPQKQLTIVTPIENENHVEENSDEKKWSEVKELQNLLSVKDTRIESLLDKITSLQTENDDMRKQLMSVYRKGKGGSLNEDGESPRGCFPFLNSPKKKIHPL